MPQPDQQRSVREEGVGLHWVRHRKPGALRRSTDPDDQLFGKMTVGYGAISGCIFMVDFEKELVVVQVRRKKDWATMGRMVGALLPSGG